MGVESIGTPSASDTAFAIAAGVPRQPPSPTPFIPSGVVGEGLSTCSIAIGGMSGAPG